MLSRYIFLSDTFLDEPEHVGKVIIFRVPQTMEASSAPIWFEKILQEDILLRLSADGDLCALRNEMKAIGKAGSANPSGSRLIDTLGILCVAAFFGRKHICNFIIDSECKSAAIKRGFEYWHDTNCYRYHDCMMYWAARGGHSAICNKVCKWREEWIAGTGAPDLRYPSQINEHEAEMYRRSYCSCDTKVRCLDIKCHHRWEQVPCVKVCLANTIYASGANGAARGGNLKILNKMLSHLSSDNATEICYSAASGGHFEAYKMVLERLPLSYSDESWCKVVSVVRAASHGHREFCTMLYDANDKRRTIVAQDIVAAAIKGGHKNTMELGLEWGAEYTIGMINLAINTGNVEFITDGLRRIKKDQKDFHSFAKDFLVIPLLYAGARLGRVDLCKMALEIGEMHVQEIPDDKVVKILEPVFSSEVFSLDVFYFFFEKIKDTEKWNVPITTMFWRVASQGGDLKRLMMCYNDETHFMNYMNSAMFGAASSDRLDTCRFVLDTVLALSDKGYDFQGFVDKIYREEVYTHPRIAAIALEYGAYPSVMSR